MLSTRGALKEALLKSSDPSRRLGEVRRSTRSINRSHVFTNCLLLRLNEFRTRSSSTTYSYYTGTNGVIRCRPFSTNPPKMSGNHIEEPGDEGGIDKMEGITSYVRKQMKHRHEGIIIHPDSIGKNILPGERVLKENKRLMTKRMVQVEQKFGYFWNLKDLNLTNNKPILSNVELIPADIAKVFPSFGEEVKSDDEDEIEKEEEPFGVHSKVPLPSGKLQTLTERSVSLPHFVTHRNRAKDPHAFCTLVAINYNDFGYKMLTSWTEPFLKEFDQSSSSSSGSPNRFETVWLSIHEGRVLNFISSFIKRSFHKKVPDHRKDKTLVYFGDSPSEMRDVLRMHNDKTGYVFLLDGIGRVRFAGSGEATQDEVNRLLTFAKKLVTPDDFQRKTQAHRAKKRREQDGGSRRILRRN